MHALLQCMNQIIIIYIICNFICSSNLVPPFESIELQYMSTVHRQLTINGFHFIIPVNGFTIQFHDVADVRCSHVLYLFNCTIY
ncbi:MAG: hypothetical protein EBR88_07500 [Betaproteobacteria bacterium]|nr:hypothetical protein [Betaproteobacteria bacterium]